MDQLRWRNGRLAIAPHRTPIRKGALLPHNAPRLKRPKSRFRAGFSRNSWKTLLPAVNAAARAIARPIASQARRAQHRPMTGQTPEGFAFRPQTRLRTDAFIKWSVVMQVRHILQGKGRDVVTVAAAASIADAAHLLAERRIGALVVLGPGGALEGIISERDLVRAIAAAGAAALSSRVSDHMTPSPATCTDTDTVEVIMETMTCGRFRHVPVVDDGGRLNGMVSIGDVVKSRIAETVSEAAALRDYITASA